MKRTVIVFLVFLGAFSYLIGQTVEENVVRLKQKVDGVVLEAPQEDLQNGEKKAGHWNFSVGTIVIPVGGLIQGQQGMHSQAQEVVLIFRRPV